MLSVRRFLWTENLYQPVFPQEFQLRENDYVVGNRKFGGNAQYLRKNRWLHHTSFLWDYNPSLMDYLLIPEKIPKYREKRNHSDFLCCLSHFLPNKEEFNNRLFNAFKNHFVLKEVILGDLVNILDVPHRKATAFIEFEYKSC